MLGEMIITGKDWIITACLLAGLLLVSFAARRFTKGVADFTIAGRKLRMWLGLSAASADGIALVSIVNASEQAFTKGFSFAWLMFFSMLITVPVIGLLGFGLKRYRATNVQSLPQYYEMRYSKGVRILAGIAIATGGVLNMAVFPKIAADFLSHFLAFPASWHIGGIDIPTSYLIMGLLLTTALYFVLTGGFVTVVATNYIQSLIMSVAIIAITFICLVKFGGTGVFDTIEKIHDQLGRTRGEAAFNMFAEGGYGFLWFLFFPIQRVLIVLSFPPSLVMTQGAETPEVARKMYLISEIFGSGRYFCILIWGAAALAVMGTMIPDGLSAADYHKVVTPMFLHKIIPPGLLGVVLAGFIFAEISTLSTYILSWSTIIVNDVVCSIKKTYFTGKQHLLVLRITIFLVAVFLFCWGLYFKQQESILDYLYLTGAIFTGGGIICFFGLYWKRTSTAAAYAALAVSMIIPLADLLLKQHWQKIAFLTQYSDKYPLKSHESGILTYALAVISLMVFSLLSRKPTHFVDFGKKLKAM